MSAYYRVDFHVANTEDLRQGFVMTSGAAPVDLTSASLRMDVETVSGAHVLEATLANARIVLVEPAQGRFEIAIPATTMRTLPEGSYRHDLVMVMGAATKRVWEGALTIDRGVTA